MRKFIFTNGEYYHIYNRGVDKRKVFLDQYDFDRFIQGIEEFNSLKPIGSIFENSFRKNKHSKRITKLVNIICYCINTNHFHMILQQCVDGGVSEFMRRTGTGFTQYFNFKHKRNGVLFQGKFKAKHINANEYLLHLSAYVNLNNRVHKVKKDQDFRSSWNEYAFSKNNGVQLCNKKIILDQFNNTTEYRKFAENSLSDILERKQMFKELEQVLLE